MAKALNQDDLVKERTEEELPPELFTEKLNIPGISKLHKEDRETIAETLSKTLLNILKSRPNLVSFTYNVGQDVEVTYRPVK